MWLALVERGPTAGIEVTGWLTDRAGWLTDRAAGQEWTRSDRWSSHLSQVLAKPRRSADPNDRAAMLVVTACGLVRDPGPAVDEPCWALTDDSTADLTVAEILAERARAKDASDAWLYRGCRQSAPGTNDHQTM